MRPAVKRHIKNRSLPLVLAHMGGAAHGPENSVEAIQAALPFAPDIIEVDVRKSRDGVLYCHHGSIPFGIVLAQFFRLLTFENIKRVAGARNTLEEVLAVIPRETTLFLDMKDTRISAHEIKKLLAGREQVWVGVYSYAHLEVMRRVLGEEHVYVLNAVPLFQSVKSDAPQKNADLGLYSWQRHTGVISSAKGVTLLRHAARWMLTTTGVSEYFVRRAEEPSVALYYNDLSKTHRSKQIKS